MRRFVLSTLILGSFFSSATAAEQQAEVKPYTLSTCIVSGEELGGMGDPVIMVHEGQEIKFCCKSCVGKFKKDPAAFIAKMEAAVAEKAAKEAAETKPAE